MDSGGLCCCGRGWAARGVCVRARLCASSELARTALTLVVTSLYCVPRTGPYFVFLFVIVGFGRPLPGPCLVLAALRRLFDQSGFVHVSEFMAAVAAGSDEVHLSLERGVLHFSHRFTAHVYRCDRAGCASRSPASHW